MREVKEYSKQVNEKTKDPVWVYLDDDGKTQPGDKICRSEMLSIPAHVEVSPRDLKERFVTLSESDNRERTKVSFDDLIPGNTKSFEKVMEYLRRNSRSVPRSMMAEANDTLYLYNTMRTRKIARIR